MTTDPQSDAPPAESPGAPLPPACVRHVRTSPGTGPRRITPTRRRIFLRELGLHGSWAEAARVASPHCRHPLGPSRSFRDLAARDADFAAQCEEARAQSDGRLEREAFRRSVEGYARPVYQQGRLVGHEMVYSDNVLLKLMASRMPETYSDRQRLEISGDLNHRHMGLFITSEDLLALDDRQREQLERILEVIADARGEPALLEHQP